MVSPKRNTIRRLLHRLSLYLWPQTVADVAPAQQMRARAAILAGLPRQGGR